MNIQERIKKFDNVEVKNNILYINGEKEVKLKKVEGKLRGVKPIKSKELDKDFYTFKSRGEIYEIVDEFVLVIGKVLILKFNTEKMEPNPIDDYYTWPLEEGKVLKYKEPNVLSMIKQMKPDWYFHLSKYLRSEEFQNTLSSIKKEYSSNVVYPEKKWVFRAFKGLSLRDIKVVIIGQDPYHDGSATGLAFDNGGQLKTSPSLKNVLKEVEDSIYKGVNLQSTANTNLARWVIEGVFLLNRVLTVRKGEPGSHEDIGWKEFTNQVIKVINDRVYKPGGYPVVFMLWGKKAQEVEPLIDQEHHLVLKAPHPSPYSADKGFFGCDHFKKANEFIAKTTFKDQIKW